MSQFYKMRKLAPIPLLIVSISAFWLTQRTAEVVVTQVQQDTPIVQEKPLEDPLDPQKILELVNSERQKVGVKPLVMDERLNQSAQAKCLDMQKYEYFSHNDIQGNSPFVLISKYYPDYQKLGENLIEGAGQTEIEFVDRWVNSPEHKENIIDDEYMHTGIYDCPFDEAWDRFSDKHFIVQHFAS